MASLNYEMERHIMRGPSDDDLEELFTDPEFRPEVALESQRSRVAWELDTERVLNEDPKWRRGPLRDLICAREWIHEWNDIYTRLRIARGTVTRLRPLGRGASHVHGCTAAHPGRGKPEDEVPQEPTYLWTVNDIVDIDAAPVAYAYCEAVFPDKAVRNVR